MNIFVGRGVINLALAAGIGVALACLATSAHAETLRLLMPWNQSSAGNYAVGTKLIELIEAETNGEVTVTRLDNSVVPVFEQLEPVGSGVFDLHYTSPGYHAGVTELGHVVDTVTPDTALRHSSGLWDLVDKGYQNFNVKVLALAPTPGYHFVLKEPVKEDGRLEGRKIRSTAGYHELISNLGGSPVQLPIGEVFTALQKGLIDGSAYPLHGLAATRLWEAVDYQLRPTFGVGTALVVINLDKWNSLSPERQEQLLAAGRKFESEAFGVIKEIAASDEAKMVENGVEFTELSPEYGNKINDIYVDGLWESILPKNEPAATELIEFIKKNDLRLR